MRALIPALVLFISLSCGRNVTGPDLSHPAYRLSSYEFNATSSLEQRVTPVPGFLLDHLKKMDGKTDYEPYTPDAKQKGEISRYLRLLPKLNLDVMKDRLVGIYFIKNFLGSGLADFIMDDQGRVYCYLIINPAVFEKGLSEWMTYREKTCFISDDPSYDIAVKCGSRYSGLMYILTHETTHIVDYVRSITPWTDEGIRKAKRVTLTETDFTRGTWKSYDETASPFPFRKNVTFYGIGGGPKIKLSESEALYREFAVSPFPTLYGTLNWAEDLAEMVTFYHISEKLGQGFSIEVRKNGKAVYALEPFRGSAVRERIRLIDDFYR